MAARVAAHHATSLIRPMADEVRGPVEQMLSVVVPGYEPTGRPPHDQPFVDVASGFFDYLVEERDFVRRRWPLTVTTCARSKPTFGASA